MSQLELFTENEVNWETSLQELFRHLNVKHWGGKLPGYRCEWSDRMITTWGCCYPSRRVIRVSSWFQTRPRRELEAVLAHEMIHIRYQGHGRSFRKELKRIGLEGDIERHFPHLVNLTQMRRRSLRYLYECPDCKLRIRRRKKIRGYCARCYQSGIRSRFLLVRHLSEKTLG